MADKLKKSIKITKQMYGWSKYGGSNHGLVQEELDEWTCQACARRQTKSLAAYMVPMDEYERDFVRVCALCKSLQLKEDLKDIFEIIHKVRKPEGLEAFFASVENLLSRSSII